MTSDAPTMAGPAMGGDAAARSAELTAEDLRLARLHLRLGMIEVARAELEDLDGRGALGVAGLAALAEARWRSGELEAAAEAARQHLDGGGDDLVAIVVAAEGAAAASRPTDARELVERAGALDAPTIDALFAGLPRRAFWPSVAGSAGAAAGGPGGPAATGPSAARDAGRGPSRTVPGPSDVMAANPDLWTQGAPIEAAPGSGRRGAGTLPPRPVAPPTWVEPARQKGHADPEAELEVARGELADAPDRGLLRLALVLRLDPTLAPDVLEAVRLRREPAALVIRGDAQRLLGRHLEAEAEFAEAAEAIERDAIARARRGGHHATPEDS
ncbi:MAG TPA: hypothetical protein VJ506_03910 [Candidatus Limnocylindrales bacterium]|nr:hypothetical protein [Candidatus Limnocylindrales bacterium]